PASPTGAHSPPPTSRPCARPARTKPARAPSASGNARRRNRTACRRWSCQGGRTPIEQVLAKTIGTDSTSARQFPGPLVARELVDVGTTVHLPTTGGANASALCWTLTLTRLRTRIREFDLVSEDTLDEALELLADPAFFDLAFATAIAWGR